MKTLNTVFLMGFVASEPVEHIFENGTKCVNVSLKTLDYYGSSENKKIDRNFHNLIFWNGMSEMTTTLLEKGDVLHINGRLKNRKIESKDGGKPIFRTEVVVTDWTKIKAEDLINKNDSIPSKFDSSVEDDEE